MNVNLFESKSHFIGWGNNIVGHYKCPGGNNKCRNKIGHQHPPKTDARTQNGNNFSIISHFGSKENHGNEGKQGAEQYCKIRYEIKIIIENYCSHGSMALHEIIDLF